MQDRAQEVTVPPPHLKKEQPGRDAAHRRFGAGERHVARAAAAADEIPAVRLPRAKAALRQPLERGTIFWNRFIGEGLLGEADLSALRVQPMKEIEILAA